MSIRIRSQLIIFASPKFNPMHGFEEPHESSFATSEPHLEEIDSQSMMNPYLGHFNNNQKGIVKMDPMSATFEPLAYHLGKKLGVNIPKTVTRQVTMPNDDNPIGNQYEGVIPVTSSVQEKVRGLPYSNLSRQEQSVVLNHPDYHKMSMYDWLIGQPDRHGDNHLYDKENNRVHAIDNGYAFDYNSNLGEHQKDKDTGDIHSSHPQTPLYHIFR